MTPQRDTILYDGICGLCGGLMRFVSRRDKRHLFECVPLQSESACAILKPHGKDPKALNTLYVVVRDSSGEHLLSKGRAVIYILRHLGGIWNAAAFLNVFPERWLEQGYDWVAARRR